MSDHEHERVDPPRSSVSLFPRPNFRSRPRPRAAAPEGRIMGRAIGYSVAYLAAVALAGVVLMREVEGPAPADLADIYEIFAVCGLVIASIAGLATGALFGAFCVGLAPRYFARPWTARALGAAMASVLYAVGGELVVLGSSAARTIAWLVFAVLGGLFGAVFTPLIIVDRRKPEVVLPTRAPVS